MSYQYTRRAFIKKSATLGAASLAAGHFLPDMLLAGEEPVSDIASVSGKDYSRITAEAVRKLGGMEKFVSSGTNVAILPNAVGKNPATTVSPLVLLGVIEMCFEAGAKEVRLIKGISENYWDGKDIPKKKKDVFDRCIISSGDYRVLPIKEGVALKEAHISKDLMNADIFINIAHVKNHSGTNFTGMLKNLMGACPHEPTNRFFHFGSNANDWYEDVDFLSQCVADLNMLRKPDLCIADSTQFLVTNGPFGPGEIKQSDTVTAGLNPVSVDAFCTRFLDLKIEEVAMIDMAAKHDLGEMNLKKLSIKETTF
jgi:uncharacterized protein (DUF362 family)